MSSVSTHSPRNVAVALWASAEPEVSGLDDDPLIAAGNRGPARGVDERRLVEGVRTVEAVTSRLAETLGAVAATMSAALNGIPEAPTAADWWQAEAVEVTFGIQISAGLNALFVAQGESSVQVVLRFARPTAVHP